MKILRYLFSLKKYITTRGHNVTLVKRQYRFVITEDIKSIELIIYRMCNC